MNDMNNVGATPSLPTNLLSLHTLLFNWFIFIIIY